MPGEEVKIIDWVLTRSASSDVHDVIFVGADGDLVLQALTISGINAFVLRESATPKAAGVGVCVSTFRSSLARARGIREPTTIDDLEASRASPSWEMTTCPRCARRASSGSGARCARCGVSASFSERGCCVRTAPSTLGC